MDPTSLGTCRETSIRRRRRSEASRTWPATCCYRSLINARVGTAIPCDKIDRQLFRVSTMVCVGNGTKAKFWQSSWLAGKAPMDFAPNLYKLAWRKQRTVQEELTNHNWTRGLWRMTTVQEMSEFVVLWDLVQNVQLSDQGDSISWKWTANGQYTAKSAYLAQLQGTVSVVQGDNIWRACAEGKLKFFA
ncbi:hypothetical protein SETIT_4G032100v2 [Setaria italica]|uniref:Reverse transcriptase zinc-binding domain-containing protein n=1 Tax=Setaria italica TaxID=4555 RepID=A0A368QQ85_SETIT|nr:hypothetical protein SETIT_4G032100v2 [Setaria italica]